MKKNYYRIIVTGTLGFIAIGLCCLYAYESVTEGPTWTTFSFCMAVIGMLFSSMLVFSEADEKNK